MPQLKSANSYPAGRTAVKRGLFVDGVWQCDCDPRLPALHFQTKNGGKNHGRWFYTCSQPQPKRCSFFLWDDDAKFRSGNTLLANSRSERENDTAPKTPSISRIRDFSQTGLLTPETGQRKRSRDAINDEDGFQGSPTKVRRVEESNGYSPIKGKTSQMQSRAADQYEEEDSFGWEDLNKDAADLLSSQDMPKIRPTTSRTDSWLEGLSKRESTASQSPTRASISLGESDTPSQPSHQKATQLQELFPPTPTPSRFAPTPLINRSATQEPAKLQLVSQTLGVLDSHHINLPPEAKKDLVDSLNAHDLRTLGILKGRDISRLAIKKREERIQELQGRISALEAEKEAWRASALGETNSQTS